MAYTATILNSNASPARQRDLIHRFCIALEEQLGGPEGVESFLSKQCTVRWMRARAAATQAAFAGKKVPANVVFEVAPYRYVHSTWQGLDTSL